MRHVSPYSFIEHAIKDVIRNTESGDGYSKYIENIAGAIKPFIQSKEGICLDSKQYAELVSYIGLKDNDISESLKLITLASSQEQNEYHLIYSEELISHYKKKCNEEEMKTSKSLFKEKYTKYIEYGIRYLTQEILDPKDLNSTTISCEGLARIILTMFNQDKYAAFPEEGNSLLEEIRVYNNSNNANSKTVLKSKIQDQKDRQIFEVKHHNEFAKNIFDQNNLQQYDERIRIVDNEGARTKKAAGALVILDNLLSYKTSDHDQNLMPTIAQSITEQESLYHSQYDINTKQSFGVDGSNYNEKIDFKKNLANVFYYHAAKHLYSAFDYKPLETKVLAPKQKGDTTTIKVYPSATGEKKSEYSIQDGKEYRDLQVNAAKGYNDHAIFRAHMEEKEIKDSLSKACIKHVRIALIPFDSLQKGCATEENNGHKLIFDSFLELIQKDYDNAKSKDYKDIQINLDQLWVQNTQQEYHVYDTLLNLSGESEAASQNYYY